MIPEPTYRLFHSVTASCADAGCDRCREHLRQIRTPLLQRPVLERRVA